MNVIVVACNGLHLGFVGAYGNPWIETPRIDRLAAEGIVFDHHYAENLTTLPTRRSWWTGRYGFAGPDSGWTPLRPDEVTLPDLLWKLGVRTALVSDVPYLRETGSGFGRGFDDVIWVRGSGYDPLVPPDDPRAADVNLDDEPGLRLPEADEEEVRIWRDRWEQLLRNRVVLGHLDDESQTGPSRVVDQALQWLQRRGEDSTPFLLWVDLFAPHGPWDLPAEYRDMYAAVDPDEFELGEEGDLADEDGPSEELELDAVTALIDVPPGAVGDVLSEEELLRLRRTYAGAVTLADKYFGILMDGLAAMGRMDDTLVVFTSDQGEPLGEHGFVRRFRPWLHEELVHTPLIVRMPGAQFGGTRRQAIVQAVDLMPTIASALGVTLPDDAPTVHGHDLLPLIRSERTKIRDYACMGMDGEELAIRTHYWHLTVPLVVDPEEPRNPELYRKPEDRWEQNDVIEQHREVAEHLELVLRRFAERIDLDELGDPPKLREIALFPPG